MFPYTCVPLELFIIVSEPSVHHSGGLGCRLPNLDCFKAFTPVLSDYVVANQALTVFQQFRRFSTLYSYKGSQFPMSLPRYHFSIPRDVYTWYGQECNIWFLFVYMHIWYNYLRTMAKIREKQQAQKLRTQGESIKQIAKRLDVSQSTVSVWCRDIELSTSAQQKLLSNAKTRNAAGLLQYSLQKRIARNARTDKNYQSGQTALGQLSNRDIFCIGLGLYWGEGYKKGNREFGFTNSDPAMIKFYVTWLDVVFSIPLKDLILRVSINQQHAQRISAVQTYWSGVTGVPLEQFTKPSLIKSVSSKQFENSYEHFGTLRIKVRKGSDFREQILGAIDSIK